MIDKGLAKVLAVLGLFTMGFLFVLRDSLAESLPVELRELLRGSGDDRRNFGPARPNDQVGARKPHTKTKMLAMRPTSPLRIPTRDWHARAQVTKRSCPIPAT